MKASTCLSSLHHRRRASGSDSQSQVAEGDGLIAIVKEKWKTLIVSQSLREDANSSSFRRVPTEDLLGHVVEYDAHFDRYEPVIHIEV